MGWETIQLEANFLVHTMSEYAGKIMTTKMHSAAELKCSCGSSLQNMTNCIDQDLRNLRSFEGKSSFGGQTISMCSTCEKKYTSNELATIAVDKELGINITENDTNDNALFDDDALWFKSSVRSKRQTLMELHIMHEFITQQKENKVRPQESEEYRKTNFIVTALRNLHSSEHCRKCFTKDFECRMKIPKRQSQSESVTFEEKVTPWCTWKGEEVGRNLFIFEGKRTHKDSYVNIYNEIASICVGCNTNVINAIDGGSVIYVTCYVSKNTQKDDKKAYSEAARIMIRKLNEKIIEIKQKEPLDGNELDQVEVQRDDDTLAGMRALIGASIIATGSHVCSATMAAYLTRNNSRFQFSHEFAYTNLNDFCGEDGQDFSIGSSTEGTPFIKSHVGNYIYRPDILENVCLYDVLTHYSVRRVTAGEKRETQIAWVVGHPARGHLRMVKSKRGKERVPCINYLDFFDTKEFGGNKIDSCDLSLCSVDELKAMEVYAKKASLLFIPFRKISNLTDESGHFLPGFRTFLSIPPKQFIDVHCHVLKHIQDCRNSLNAGRPLDALEKVTVKPDLPDQDRTKRAKDDECFDIYETLISNLDHVFTDKVDFRTEDNMFSMDTSVVRECGKSGCGSKLLRTPVVDTNANIVIQSAVAATERSTRVGEGGITIEKKKHYRSALYTLAIKMTERKVEHGVVVDVTPSGNLQNIREYANFVFGDDRHQKKAFELIVAAFVVELYKIPESLGKRKYLIDIVKPLMAVNHDGQFIAFLSGPGGTGKSKVIHAVLGYCKRLCNKVGMEFNKRTIVVTALTGAAAVSIFGETVHSACFLNTKKIKTEMTEEWKDTLLVVVDEISFASESILRKINENMNILKEIGKEGKFGRHIYNTLLHMFFY